MRRAFKQQLPGGNDGHARTQLADVFNDVGRENYGDVAADRGKQIQKAIALSRVEAGGGFVDDNQAWLAQQRLRDAEALFHAARGGAEGRVVNGEPLDGGVARQVLDLPARHRHRRGDADDTRLELGGKAPAHGPGPGRRNVLVITFGNRGQACR